MYIIKLASLCTASDDTNHDSKKSILDEKERKYIKYVFKNNIYIPSVSQRSPVYPTGHKQENDVPLFEQVPPLQHGALAHGEPKLETDWLK